jgi:hypothetical protein
MSIVTRIEAGFVNVPSEHICVIVYPSGGLRYGMVLGRAWYPHRQAVIEAVNAWFTSESLPLTMSENYATGDFAIVTSANNFDLEVNDNSNGFEWFGMGSDANNTSSVTFDTSTQIMAIDCPIYDETYSLVLNRAANFADNGRVGAALINRYMKYDFAMYLTNTEHSAFVDFWPWISQTRKLCIFRRWDSSKTPAQNYLLEPLHGSDGFKLLFLDQSTADALDNPAQEPFVNGHSFTMSGILYGV